MFIPQNEAGVMYLFSRYHEEIGFEKILKFNTTTGFPDIIALRDGKEVRIELEHTLGKIRVHYERIQSNNFGWTWDEDNRLFREKDRSIPKRVYEWFLENLSKDKIDYRVQQFVISRDNLSDNAYSFVSDPFKELKLGARNNLVYKSIKKWVDVIICWEIGSYRLKDNLEVIELKNKLIQTKIKEGLHSIKNRQ